MKHRFQIPSAAKCRWGLIWLKGQKVALIIIYFLFILSAKKETAQIFAFPFKLRTSLGQIQGFKEGCQKVWHSEAKSNCYNFSPYLIDGVWPNSTTLLFPPRSAPVVDLLLSESNPLCSSNLLEEQAQHLVTAKWRMERSCGNNWRRLEDCFPGNFPSGLMSEAGFAEKV